jgi:hypothetical protein
MKDLDISQLFDVRILQKDVQSTFCPKFVFVFKDSSISSNGDYDKSFLSFFSPPEIDERMEVFEKYCVTQKYRKSTTPAFMSLHELLWKLNAKVKFKLTTTP